MDYTYVVTSAQSVHDLKQEPQNNANFEVRVKGAPPAATLATVELEAWKWATHVCHQDAGWLLNPDSYRFFYLWNCDLEGV
jgi:hypothetical protein